MFSDYEQTTQEALKHPNERSACRNTFLRKVYSLIFLQFVVAFSTIFVAKSIPVFTTWIKTYPTVAIASGIIQLLLMILVFIRRRYFRHAPVNILTYLLFTIALSWNLTYIAVTTNPIITLYVVALAGFLFFGLLLYAFSTKRDLTYLGGAIFVIGSVLATYEVFLITTKLDFFKLVSLGLGAIVLGFYLIYETQFLIVGQSLASEMEDPFVGSVILYDDIILISFKIIEGMSKVFKKHRH